VKKMKLGLFIVGSLLLILLSACGTGSYAVTGGHAFGYIMNPEVRKNGSYMIWLYADSTTVYCTFDKTKYDLAIKWADEHRYIHITYNSINSGDADGEFLGQGCDGETTGVQTLRLLSMELSAYEQTEMAKFSTSTPTMTPTAVTPQ
jgi:hypothetical protein